MKIVITDARTVTDGDMSFDFLNKYGETAIYELTAPEDVEKRVCDADIILCNKTVLSRKNLKNAEKLKYIGLFATGYNNIDVEYTNSKGIIVCNAGSYSTSAVAQQTLAYILEFYTRTAEYNSFVQDGGWKQSKFFSPFVFPSYELDGKTLGIVGYGNIGRAVARRAAAFGMKILAFTRTVREDGQTEFVTLDELLKRSDVVTVHCPQTDETKGMFDARTFSKMKDGAYFINTARGGVMNEDDLITALSSGKLAGAAVDVLETEPMSDKCRLCGTPKLIITPHIAWTPYETRVRLLSIVKENIEAYLRGEPVNVVGKGK